MPDKKHYPLIRTIYLYVFSLLGLVLLTIGAVNFINMGLKAFVFTKAEQDMEANYRMLSIAPLDLEKIETYSEGSGLSEEELVLVRDWLKDYKAWQEEAGRINYLASSRHREAARNLSLILVGLPLYLYHWFVIKKEIKEGRKA